MQSTTARGGMPVRQYQDRGIRVKSLGRETVGPNLQEQLRREDSAFHSLLLDSTSLEQARSAIFDHIHGRERNLYQGSHTLHPVEHATACECLRTMKQIIAPRSEDLAGFSTLDHLRRLVRSDPQPGHEVIAPGFVLEFIHLVRGMAGRSGMAQGWLGGGLAQSAQNLPRLSGRRAGVARSEFLDRLGDRAQAGIERYPTGLDPELIAKRTENRQRILDVLGGTAEDWTDYRWQLRHLFKGRAALDTLPALVPLTDPEREAIALAVEHGIPFGITPHYLSLFDFEGAERTTDAVVRAQVIPPLHYVRTMIKYGDDRTRHFDFMGEHDTSPVPLVTRRYSSVAILKGYDTCPQICVYCQRNWEITGPMEAGALPSRESLDQALGWFEAHPNVRDVLITGGDPLFVSDRRIEYMMDRLARIDHVMHIRWGTRSLVTMPMRITDHLAELLGRYVEPGRRIVGIVTHIEDATEVTPGMAEAVHRLRTRGLNVYNQQVLTLHGSRRFQAAANRVAMKRIGIDPYYTFFPKGKEETRDYGIPLARLQQERKEEARLLPGSFRTDEPVFNVPRLGKNHVRATQDRELVAIRPDGRRLYLWHPWEKGITPTQPWLYCDRSIHRYLRELERLGEDPGEYSSIWYYY